ncbi:MAG: LLM class flavin-dependent oxidoreductase, partial [Candidatus Thorarchaeota archaeon]
LISALASVTKKLRLGTLVTGNSYRYPAILAKLASSVDMISNGRLEFGIGAGWKEIEYNAYGIPFLSIKDRMDSLDESIQIIKLLWTQPKASFMGKFHSLKDAYSAPKPQQVPHPPIFIGGSGKKRILKMVAKYGNYCNFGWFVGIDNVPDLLNTLKSHCESINRDYDSIGKSFFCKVVLGETQDELDEILSLRAKNRGINVDEFKKLLGPDVFLGTPEIIEARFQELINMGFDYFQIVFLYGRDLEDSKKFAKLIIPRFQ